MRPFIGPVYDYVLVTEPLDAAQLDSIGWRNRQGIGDIGNQFHYYRLTADHRILFGGYDAVYHWRNGAARRPGPAAGDVRDAGRALRRDLPAAGRPCGSRTPGAGRSTRPPASSPSNAPLSAAGSPTASATPGSGVAATRFGAQVMLDLVDGVDSEATRLRAVRSRPVPFPPEPVRWAGIELTRRGLARADERQGRRGPWLRLLDRLGMGFDS